MSSPPPTHPQPPQPPQPPSPARTSTTTITTPRVLLRAARPTDADALHAIFSNADVMRYWDTLPHTSPAQTAAWLGKMVASPANGVSEFVVCRRGTETGGGAGAVGVGAEEEGGAAASSSSSSASPLSSEPSTTNQSTDDAGFSDRLSSGTSGTGSGEAIGKIGIWRGSEIGFLLHRAYWRQSLMREAMEALLPYYFGPVPKELEDEERGGGGRGMGIDVITADADPRNTACIEFLTGFGFEVTGREERTFRVGPYGGGVGGDVGGGGGGEWVDSVYLALRRETWLERERQRGLEKRGG